MMQYHLDILVVITTQLNILLVQYVLHYIVRLDHYIVLHTSMTTVNSMDYSDLLQGLTRYTYQYH